MRYSIVYILLVIIYGSISSCTVPPTMEELVRDAARTGDWSLVSEREAEGAYDLAMEAATGYCQQSQHVLICVGLPRRQNVKYIYRYCGCGVIR